ncbi:FecCD family ABC transporter permease [Bailinhaonella thermotolerans]|uniref:FecCD family ABC transporter permease n=1 Tax=Bailinhaonella thermotolerans TaxID=1070861 RepID=UPI00192A5ED2|nr:iron ABC transporter permease [Bailinhaonella thermotolerans]
MRPLVLSCVLVVLAVALLAGLTAGAAGIPPAGVLRALADALPFVSLDTGLAPVDQTVLFELRLPRVLIGAAVGGLLAIAGAGYQGVFRNPLADPYLLGAGGGAGLGATIMIVFFSDAPDTGVPLAAFAGAVGGVLLAYNLGRAAGGRGTVTLVLAGVAVSSFLAAVQAFLQQLRVEELERIYAWIMGGLESADWETLTMIAPYSAVSVAVLFAHGRLLDVLSVGDDEATSLGVSAARVRFVVLAASSLATACAVAVSGLVGFVGVVIPHVARRLAGGSYRAVLPLSFLLGAAFLVLVDLLARTVIAPGELALGVVTAFVGAPFFVGVLRATRREAS